MSGVLDYVAHDPPEGDRPRHRDPLTLAVAIGSLVIQVGASFWWGGRIDQRVTAIEVERAGEKQVELARADRDAKKNEAIAVVQAQYTEIIQRLQRIEDREVKR